MLFSHYPRNPADAGETEATLRAYTDTGLRVGFAASLFTRNFFSYDDTAFLKILPDSLRERAARLGRADATTVDRFFAEVRRLTERYAGGGRGAAAVRILHGPVAPQWVAPEERPLPSCRSAQDRQRRARPGPGVRSVEIKVPDFQLSRKAICAKLTFSRHHRSPAHGVTSHAQSAPGLSDSISN